MEMRLKGILKKPFVRHMVTLMAGTSTAQLLTILAAPVLTRIYTPTEFGAYALYTTVVVVALPLLTARYELAIVPASSKTKAVALLLLSTWIAVALSVLFALAILLLGRSLFEVLQVPELFRYAAIIPVAMALSGPYRALRYLANRVKDYRRLARSTVAQSVFTLSTQVGLGLLTDIGAWGLVVGYVAGLSAALVYLGGCYASSLLRWASRNAGRALLILRSVAVEYKEHPQFLVWGGLLDVLGQRLPVLVLAALSGPQFLGLFALADRVIKTPVSLIGQAASQVLFQRMSAINTARHARRVLLRWAAVVGGVAVLPFLALFLIGEPLFGFIFGSEWTTAGTVAGRLTPYFLGVLVVSPISTFLIVARRNRRLFVIQVLFVTVAFLSLYFGHQAFGTGLGAVTTYALAQAGVYVFYFMQLLGATRGFTGHARGSKESGNTPGDAV